MIFFNRVKKTLSKSNSLNSGTIIIITIKLELSFWTSSNPNDKKYRI